MRVEMGIRGFATWTMGLLLLVTAACAAAAQESVIYSFGQYADGRYSASTPIFDAAGNLYGTSSQGGLPGEPYFNTNGTVYELSPGTGGTWTETVLYNFGTVAGDGANPSGSLTFDAAGNLYGTAATGGAHSVGIVFELSPGAGPGGAWTEKVLYSFQGGAADGANPERVTLVWDAKGNLYGTTKFGGAYGSGTTGGTVFELSPGTGGAWTEKLLYSFGSGTDAAEPVAGVTLDAAGNLFGTTLVGGIYGDGAVYELSPAIGGTWTEKVLHSFNENGVDGKNPYDPVIFDPQGNLYGTTYGGGANPNFLGTVFELSPSANGEWTEQVIHTCTGDPYGTAPVPDGDFPYGGLVFDAAGNLYGTASGGGFAGHGGVYEMSPGPGGWTEKLLYGFGAPLSDGHGPAAKLVFDAAGNLYGTTLNGGANSVGQYGTVFEIAGVITANPQFSPAPGAYSGAKTITITDTTADATIYYTINGGASPTKYTAPFEVSESSIITAYATSPTLPRSQVAMAGYQIGSIVAIPEFSPVAGTYTVAQSVTITDAAPGATIYYTTNGAAPTTSSTKYTGPIDVSSTETIEAIAVDTGLTESVSASAKYTITPVTPPQEEVLFNFGASSTDGLVPSGGLVSDANGNLYGTTTYGGANEVAPAGKMVSAGTVFELSPATGGGWTEKTLYNFGASSTDGALPTAGLIFDSNGNLYGTTAGGGKIGMGTVFELVPSTGGTWTEKILWNFGLSITDGEVPEAGLIFDSNGNLYGTTEQGGANTTWAAGSGGWGTVFELSPAAGGTWTEKVLYAFGYLSQTDGYFPTAGVIFDSKGNLFGTTSDGGSGQDLEGGGTIFELSPTASGPWTQTVLYSFGGGSPTGYRPEGGLVMDTEGNLYGTANSGGNGFGLDGTLFELSPAPGGGWTQTVLHSFGAYEADGINPTSTLIFDAKGNLYGTTYSGGANQAGMVFELTPETSGGWTEQALYNFGAAGSDAAHPFACLIFNSAGNLFGTTKYGGTNGSGSTGGTAFEIKTGATTAAQEPQFSPGAGTYTSAQSVTITDATSGSTIYYTTNGTTPTTSSTKYSSAITVPSTETIKAIAVATGFSQSAVASATFTINLAAASPIFTPGAGTYTKAQSVTITDATSGATIYYTTNGTTPTASSTKYTAAIAVSTTETIEAIAIATDLSQSAVASATYTINSTTMGSGLQFIPVTPCRVADTRNANGPFGGPEMGAGTSRTFNIPQSACSIPSTAVAYSLNVTVVPSGALNYLTMWPSGQAQPNVSTLNSDGRVKANAAITPAGTNGGVSVFVSDATHVILDIDGYFVPAGTASALAFYPVTPCRIADTRNATGPLGAPFLGANTSRAFPVQSSSCGIPSTAKAYSLNVTAVPHTTLNYLTTWPTGQTQPNVSTLNAPTGTVVANAAVVPAGSGGDISIFVSDDADLILDVNGYFAPPATGG